MFEHTRIVNPQPNRVLAQYDPRADGRRCSVCGAHDRWQRITEGATSGGWFCCWPFAPKTHDREMVHVCSTLYKGVAS